MASKTKKALESIYALGSSKLFLITIIFSAVSQLFSTVYSIINQKIGLPSALVVLFSVISFVGLFVLEYGTFSIYRQCRNEAISYKGFTILLWYVLISVVVGLVSYIVQVFYATKSVASDGDFEEMAIVFIFITVMALFVLIMSIPFCVIDCKAILYLRNIEDNITVRPKKLTLLFVDVLLTLLTVVFMLCSDMFELLPALVSEFSAISLFKVILCFFDSISSVILCSLYLTLIYRFNKIMKPLIK